MEDSLNALAAPINARTPLILAMLHADPMIVRLHSQAS